jgi:alpha-L-fucosidase
MHILAWPEETLKLPALPAKIVTASLLGGGSVDFKQMADGVEIAVPKSARQEIDTVVVLKLDKPAMEIAPIVASLAG